MAKCEYTQLRPRRLLIPPATTKQHPPPSDSASDSESDYSSSDVTEDEDGAELTPALDAAILRTLSKIKNKQGVYGDNNVLQEELKEAEEKAKKLGLKQGQLNRVKDKVCQLPLGALPS
jgi:protein KRI1